MLVLALGVTTVETDPMMLEKSMDFVLAILNTCSKDKRQGNTSLSKINDNDNKHLSLFGTFGRNGSRNLSEKAGNMNFMSPQPPPDGL